MEEFEDLIRKGSAHEEYSIQDGDWEQLQMMMNASDRRKNMGWIWRDTIVFLLLGAWLLLGNENSPIDIEIVESINITEGKSLEKNGMKKSANADLTVESQGILTVADKDNFQAITQLEASFSETKNDRTEEEETLVSDTEATASAKENDPTEVTPVSDTEATASAKENDPTKVTPVSDTEATDSNAMNDPTKETQTSNPDTKTQASDKANDLPKVIPAPLSEAEPEPEPKADPKNEAIADNTAPKPLPVDSMASNPANENAVNRKMHLYLGIGADWSVASPLPVGPTKLKLQIGGEYQFLKKWSVLTGLNYTVKAYQTNAEDYAVTPGFWPGGIKPSSILAECNVLEIPLNVRYYFTAQDRRRSSFYLTAGASSYLMASERYRFTYDVNDPTLKQEWNGKWKNMHYFGVLHLSAGYQKSFEKNWSVLLEPYVDLPLTGIGFGEVDLVSFGLSLGVKY